LGRDYPSFYAAHSSPIWKGIYDSNVYKYSMPDKFTPFMLGALKRAHPSVRQNVGKLKKILFWTVIHPVEEA
jgi:hypothetical protein